jgi:S phase cyclin A-associated protein in the endoplasmic reticulum
MNDVSSSSDYHRRLRTALLANLNRSIADLYQLCDEEEDILMCVDATSLFERGVSDFRVLSDRLSARKKVGLDQNSVRMGIPRALHFICITQIFLHQIGAARHFDSAFNGRGT